MQPSFTKTFGMSPSPGVDNKDLECIALCDCDVAMFATDGNTVVLNVNRAHTAKDSLGLCQRNLAALQWTVQDSTRVGIASLSCPTSNRCSGWLPVLTVTLLSIPE